MTLSNAAAEPDTLEFETTIERGGTEVVLSETYFYPEGGGQPADRGTLGGHRVLDVQREDDAVVHLLDGELEPGEPAVGVVDPAFRRYCTRAHTASHVLYGAGRRLLDDLGYGGFDITPEKVRVDFTTSTQIDDDVLVELERLTNRCVWESRDVTWRQLPRADALDRADVAFNTKTEEGLGDETVRIVEIDEWDVAACGGTHVSNTDEIGPVTVLDRSNPGEGMTRIEFAVGPSGIDRRTMEKRATLGSATALGTGVSALSTEVERLLSERNELKAECDALQEELLEYRVSAIAGDAFDKDGNRWAADVVDADATALAEAVRSRPDGIDVLALVTPGGKLAVGAGPVDAGAVVDELTAAFGGGGGGSSDVAQAGGLEVDGEELLAYLRE